MQDTILVTEKNSSEVEPHVFLAEASELRLPVGVFPNSLPTTLGNRQPFQKVSQFEHKVIYRQFLGCLTLTIYND